MIRKLFRIFCAPPADSINDIIKHSLILSVRTHLITQLYSINVLLGTSKTLFGKIKAVQTSPTVAAMYFLLGLLFAFGRSTTLFAIYGDFEIILHFIYQYLHLDFGTHYPQYRSSHACCAVQCVSSNLPKRRVFGSIIC